jgi:hypothetical protein
LAERLCGHPVLVHREGVDETLELFAGVRMVSQFAYS